MKEVILNFIKNNRGIFTVYIIILFLIAFERIAIPHFYGQLLGFLKNANFQKVWKMFIILIAIYFTFQLLDTIITVIDSKIIPLFEDSIRRNIINNIIDKYQQNYHELDLGNITSKIIKLPSNLRDLFFQVKGFLFRHVLSLSFTIGYLFFCHLYLGSCLTFGFLILGLIAFTFCRSCKNLSYQRENIFDSTQESIQDTLFNLLSVYTNNNEKEEKKIIENIGKKTINAQTTYIQCGIPYRIIFAIVFIFIFAGVTGISIHLYKKKKISLALLSSSFIVMFTLLRTCISFYFDFESFIYLYGGIKVVLDYIDNLPSPKKSIDKSIPQKNEKIDISFQNISFQYNKTKSIFTNFNLEIPFKQKLTIMGEIGSGKSTFAKLLLKLKPYKNGDILLNGVSINNINVKEIRRLIYYIPQNPRLFNRSLWKNISYGNKNLKLENVYLILEMFGMKELKQIFKEKMFDNVGKQGENLSGGQRQMVWLLRAFFNESPVLILDEPTSSLDKKSSENVLKIIEYISKRKTTIIITHDSSLVRITDRVITIGNNQILNDTQNNS